VPKIQTPKTLNKFRPVALASLVMKAFKRLVKDALLDTVQKWAIGTLLNVFFFLNILRGPSPLFVYYLLTSPLLLTAFGPLF